MTPQMELLERPAVSAVASTYPKFRWAVLAASCLSVIAFQVSVMSYGPLLGEISRNLGITLAQGVNLMTMFMLFAALSYFVAGPLCDRAGIAVVITTSTVLSALPAAAIAWFGQSYQSVLVVRALQGSAVGFAMAGMAPLVLQWFPPQQRGLALGIPGACNPLGVILGVLLSPVLFRSTGSWQQAVVILSAFGWFALVYAVVVFRMAKSCAPQAPRAPEGTSTASIFSAAMRSPFTWVGVFVTFATNWIMQSAFSLSPSYFAEAHPVGLGLGPVAAGQLMGVVQIGAIVGPIVGGILLDKVFVGRARGVILIGFVLSMVYCTIQFTNVCNSRPLFLLCLAAAGAGIGMLFPAIQSQINELYDHSIVGRMNGVWLGIGAFGGSAGLFANAMALRNTGSYIVSINIISAAAVLGLLLCAIKPRSPKQV